ncbi:MAG: hypothetical protein JXQ81_02290 [Desulfuromonadales bacterium]|nr:hypothetical protein [Desulfuromonadales bacterium]MBN2791315.1 hypothetical protein [Desulfuromonadales bacterium]
MSKIAKFLMAKKKNRIWLSDQAKKELKNSCEPCSNPESADFIILTETEEQTYSDKQTVRLKKYSSKWDAIKDNVLNGSVVEKDWSSGYLVEGKQRFTKAWLLF